MDCVAIVMQQAKPLRITHIRNVVSVFAQMLDGIRALHAMRFLHRDVKGPNVMQFPDGRVKWIDFGMSTQMCGQPLSSVVYTEPVRPPELFMPQATAVTNAFNTMCTEFINEIGWPHTRVAQPNRSSTNEINNESESTSRNKMIKLKTSSNQFSTPTGDLETDENQEKEEEEEEEEEDEENDEDDEEKEIDDEEKEDHKLGKKKKRASEK